MNTCTPDKGYVTRVRCRLRTAFREFLDARGWCEVSPPMLTNITGACEDASTVFSLPYFEESACLRQTAQLHLEPLVQREGKVYTIGRSFRKEPVVDDRHLTEFELFECEGQNLDLDDLLQLQEDLVEFLCEQRHSLCRELTAFGATEERFEFVKFRIPRIRYDDAIVNLQRRGRNISWGEDLTAEDEKFLCTRVGSPVFLTHHPVEMKFFNMKRDPDNPSVVLSCDLLLPGVGESAGGSVREEDEREIRERLSSSRLARQLSALGKDETDFEWYLSQSHVPRAGFGLGFERFVQWYCGLSSVTEATEYPRTAARLVP